MITRAAISFALGLLLLVSNAWAQAALLQGGPMTAGHVPMYVTAGTSQPVVQDAGGAGGGAIGASLSEMGLTVRGTGTAPYANAGTGPNGENWCDYDAPTTNATGYHVLCLSPNAGGGGLLSYQAGGTASTLPLQFKVNGTTYQFPFSIGGVVGPSVSVVNDAACWNNLVGTLLADCGAFVTVGGNNTWTGTNNFTGTVKISGTTENFPASGNIVGTSDSQTLTNKSIAASQINSGVLPGTVMPALTGDVTSSAGTVATTIANNAVTNAKLATATQNSVKGAATSTAVADLGVPSCSSANNALQWTTNTGFSCATVTATTAGFGINLAGGVFSISQTQPPFGFNAPVNLGLTASVGSSNLTINLVGANGSAPSSTNPVLIPFRSTTLATGVPVWSAITSALSIVVPSGATLGSSNATPFRIWLFAEYNAGTPELAVAICSVSPNVFPCQAWETSRITSTSITGLSTTAGTLYATTGVSNDAVRIIGYAEYSAGLTTAGLYASTPTTLQIMGPGVWKPGDVVQTQMNITGTEATGTTVLPQDNTIPQNTEGDQFMTQAITPLSTSDILEVEHRSQYTNSIGSAASVAVAMFQDSTANALSTMVGATTPTTSQPLTLLYRKQAGTTSSTTFKIRAGGAAGTTTFCGLASTAYFGGTMSCSLKITEIMGSLDHPANDNLADERAVG